jgi:hypothetical protein
LVQFFHIPACRKIKPIKMKKIFLIIILLTIKYSLSAQTVEYDTCSYLQQYAGEWRYVNGNDTIRIYLRFHRDHTNDPKIYISDNLYGWLEYKKGNTIVESTYQNRFMALPYNFDSFSESSYSIYLHHPLCGFNASKLTGYIIDIAQAREIKNVKATISLDKNIITWNQEHKEGYGVFSGAYGMTLPKNFVLIRQ